MQQTDRALDRFVGAIVRRSTLGPRLHRGETLTLEIGGRARVGDVVLVVRAGVPGFELVGLTPTRPAADWVVAVVRLAA